MAKIMLCDDSSTILMVLERKLREGGHEVVGKAKDGEEGVAVYEDTRPELLILDVTMPNKDGRECLKAIMTNHPTAKVIMLTALLDKGVVDECMSVGAKAFLSKSDMPNENFGKDLCALVDKIIKAA
jgi:two-component system chemotaxis response regulator CheY